MASLDGRVAVVTGAAGGLGRAQVGALAAAGAAVVATDLPGTFGDAERAGGSLTWLAHDVRSLDGWQAVVSEAERRFGPVSTLVNNAGIIRHGPIEEMPEADYRAVLDVNLVGAFLGIKSVVASMRAAGGGAIVNVASMDGIIAHPGIAGYVSSKFGLRGLTRVAALELGSAGIRVNALCPGYVATPLTARIGDEMTAGLPIPRMGTPDEVARAVVFLASDDCSYATGAEFVMDGGYTAR